MLFPKGKMIHLLPQGKDLHLGRIRFQRIQEMIIWLQPRQSSQARLTTLHKEMTGRREEASIHTIWIDLRSILQMIEHPTRVKLGEIGFHQEEEGMGAMTVTGEEINLVEDKVIVLVMLELRSGSMICIKRQIRILFHRTRMIRLQSWKHYWLHNSKQQPVCLRC